MKFGGDEICIFLKACISEVIYYFVKREEKETDKIPYEFPYYQRNPYTKTPAGRPTRERKTDKDDNTLDCIRNSTLEIN
jgi:hypothetical protein